MLLRLICLQNVYLNDDIYSNEHEIWNILHFWRFCTSVKYSCGAWSTISVHKSELEMNCLQLWAGASETVFGRFWRYLLMVQNSRRNWISSELTQHKLRVARVVCFRKNYSVFSICDMPVHNLSFFFTLSLRHRRVIPFPSSTRRTIPAHYSRYHCCCRVRWAWLDNLRCEWEENYFDISSHFLADVYTLRRSAECAKLEKDELKRPKSVHQTRWISH